MRDLEIIVSDNFSQDDTPAVLGSFSDPRLRTLRTDRRLSMCDHWEFALRHARGDFIMFIGDDDAVVPGGLMALVDLIRKRPASIYSWKPPVYAWPMDDRPAWVRHMPRPSREEEVALLPIVRRVFRYGGWHYSSLPCVYHSAVERRILDTIRTRTGRVFHSTQPDVFTSMALPAFAPFYVRASRPVTMHGISAKSNGGAFVRRDGRSVVLRFIEEYGGYSLHRFLYPDLRAFSIFVIDAILVASEVFPEYYGGMRFNFDAMWAFLYKIGGVSRWEPLRKRRLIARHHRFNTPRFLCYLTLQEAIIRARQAFVKIQSFHPVARNVPSNILDFVQAYSKSLDAQSAMHRR